jgi:pyruvate dehydrogenase E2 component (dihydrolipoamide acetyltransferase)
VTKADVLAAQARGHTGAAATQAAGATGVDGSMFFPDFTDMPVKMVQKITAQRLTESKQQIPHYYLSVSLSERTPRLSGCQMGPLFRWR